MNNKGVALIITFIFMVSLTTIAAAYLFLVTYDTRNAAASLNNDKALYLADAGLNKAVWYLTNAAPDLSEDGSWRTAAYPTAPGPGDSDPRQESLGDGTYTIWVDGPLGGDIVVTARGSVSGVVRTVQETITLGSDVPEAFNKVQYSGGTIDFRSSSGNITGDIDTVGTVDNEGGMTITGTVTEGSSVATPSVNMASYAGIATTTVSGNTTFNPGTYNGIWYVDGKATIQDNVTVNGTIIATGNIDVGNCDNLVVNPSSNYPALVAGGNITGTKMKTAVISGLVYAAGSVSLGQGSNNTVTGALISAGNMDLKNGSGWSLTYDPNLAMNPPPYFTAGSGTAMGDGWKEI